MKKEEILYMKITVYHPNLNRLIERTNRDLKNFLRKFIKHKNN